MGFGGGPNAHLAPPSWALGGAMAILAPPLDPPVTRLTQQTSIDRGQKSQLSVPTGGEREP